MAADQGVGFEQYRLRTKREVFFGRDECHRGVASAVVTAANVHDKHPLPDPLHGNERRVYGDSAYASEGEAPQ